MILIEQEPTLPGAVESVKAQVLVCLRAMHAVRDYTGREDLADFLDQVLDDLVAYGAPRGLSRVLLFYRDPWAVIEVEKRLSPGAVFQRFQAPGCWMPLGQRLPELRAWALKIEPEWAAAMLKGI